MKKIDKFIDNCFDLIIVISLPLILLTLFILVIILIVSCISIIKQLLF